MTKSITRQTALLLLAVLLCISLPSCANIEKEITVVVREPGSGTREAFDKVVTDGVHFLEEKDKNGKKIYNTTKYAIQQTKTGTVLSTVANDKNAIGYISLFSVNSLVKAVAVEGVLPNAEAVLSGKYKIQRPYVLMTNANVSLSARASDFMSYLYSSASREHSQRAGCIFLEDADKRGNGKAPIEIKAYTPLPSLPSGEKIVIRGSTSTEKFISSAARSYAELYGSKPEEIFDIQLEGSSVGRRAVERDKSGNVIGLSSAYVDQEDIHSFNACLDAIAVVVNKDNSAVSNLSLRELYDIFSGQTKSFSQLSEEVK